MANLFLIAGGLVLFFRDKMPERIFTAITSLLTLFLLIAGMSGKITYFGVYEYEDQLGFGFSNVTNHSAFLFICLIILLYPVFGKASFKRNSSHYFLAPIFLGSQSYLMVLVYALVTLGLKTQKNNFEFILIALVWGLEALLRYSTNLESVKSETYVITSLITLVLIYYRIFRVSRIKSVSDPIEIFLFSFIVLVNIERITPDLSVPISIMTLLAVLVGSLRLGFDYGRAANGALVAFSLFFFMRPNPSWPEIVFASLVFLILRHLNSMGNVPLSPKPLKSYEYIIPYSGVFLGFAAFGIMARDINEYTALYLLILLVLSTPKIQYFVVNLIEARSRKVLFLSLAMILVSLGLVVKEWVA